VSDQKDMANAVVDLSDQELLRYSRQIMMPEIDIAGQLKLKNAKVLIVGLGGLGCPVALYLAAAGVGQIELLDFDLVDESNLQRQIAHAVSTVGQAKVESAAAAVLSVNPDCQVVTHNRQLDADCAEQIFSKVDVVVDASDNFATRFLINEKAWQAKKVVISGAAIRFEGQVSVYDFRSEQSPCYACLYQDISEEQMTCSETGVVSPLVGIIGSVQAMETIKVIVDIGRPLIGRLLLLDALSMEWRTMRFKRDEHCAVCSGR
jgi:adenylyltransferase/sulfurtransferase